MKQKKPETKPEPKPEPKEEPKEELKEESKEESKEETKEKLQSPVNGQTPGKTSNDNDSGHSSQHRTVSEEELDHLFHGQESTFRNPEASNKSTGSYIFTRQPVVMQGQNFSLSKPFRGVQQAPNVPQYSEFKQFQPDVSFDCSKSTHFGSANKPFDDSHDQYDHEQTY